jgi:hypothetical protein
VAARHRGRDPEVIRITSAPESPSAELGHRERRYIISMTIRTVCFVGAIVVGGGWLRWVLVAAAFVLPYVAVVMANSASPRVEGTDLGPDLMHPQLGSGFGSGRPDMPKDQPARDPDRGTI